MGPETSAEIALIKRDAENTHFGFIENEEGLLKPVCAVITGDELASFTILKMLKDCLDVDISWLDIQKSSFYNYYREKESYVVLMYSVIVPNFVNLAGGVKWFSVEDISSTNKLDIEVLKRHANCLIL